MKALAMLAGIAILSCASPAAAQTENPPAASSPCQAEPDANSNAGNDGAGAAEKKPPAGDLTKKLDPCNGILEPPPIGDDDMTEPAPNEGNTPIIRPGEVPQQPPKQ